MANIRKASQDQRGTYKLMDGNGKVIQELRPGENGITEWHIKKMRPMDDLDVVNYYKNARPNRTEEEKAKIKEWEREYIHRSKSRDGYEPHPSDVKEEINEQFQRNYNVSLNEYTMNANKVKIQSRNLFMTFQLLVMKTLELTDFWDLAGKRIAKHHMKDKTRQATMLVKALRRLLTRILFQ